MPHSLRDYAKRLGGELHGARISCPGPGHSPGDRSLSVSFRSDGSFTAYSFANDDWASCMDHIRALCGLPQFDSREERTTQKPFVAKEAKNRRIEEKSSAQIARRLWEEAQDPTGTLVETYLASRKLFLPAEAVHRTIRFHPNCPFKGQHDERFFAPAMVCRYSPVAHDLEPEAPPTAIHRTALKADGSGYLTKQMLSSPLGQCVKLSPDENVTEGLVLAEGIENGLTAAAIGLLPVWAASTSGIMQTFPVLAGIECLTIFADNDVSEAGWKAATECRHRWRSAGREARIIMPAKQGNDWNDEIMS